MQAKMEDAEARRKVRAAKREAKGGVLRAVNSCTKFAVSGAAFAALVHFRNAEACWALTGSILSSFNCKFLKHLLNHERPESAPKADPGMPSAHAQSLAFLSTYAILHLAKVNAMAAFALQAISLFLAWLRVEMGYHTLIQVVVGYLLGASSSAAWFFLGRRTLPQLLQNPEALKMVYAAVVVSMVLFAGLFGKSWMKELTEGLNKLQQGMSKRS